MPFGTEVRLGAGDIVLDGDSAALHEKGHSSPHFLHRVCSVDQGATCCRGGLGPGHIVFDEDTTQLPPSKKTGRAPQFSANVCCGQMAGWIEMPLSIEVGLGLGHIVLDGDPAIPPQRGTAP